MILSPIDNGIVLDHIKPGGGFEIYNTLKLGELSCQVALILNANSVKMGKKDIIKIAETIDLDLDVIGYIDPGVTVNFVKDGKVVVRKHLEAPELVKGVIKCKNLVGRIIVHGAVTQNIIFIASVYGYTGNIDAVRVF